MAEEVELGGLDDENDRKSLFGSVDNEYHLFEKDEVSLNLTMHYKVPMRYLILYNLFLITIPYKKLFTSHYIGVVYSPHSTCWVF